MKKTTLEKLLRRTRGKGEAHTDSAAANLSTSQEVTANNAVAEHAIKRSGPHGSGPNYLATTPRADQRIAWKDIQDKPDLALADFDLDDILSETPANGKAPKAPTMGDPVIDDGWLSFAIARITDLTWSTITGKPSTFPPDAHFHGLSDLLQGSATTGQYPRWSGTAWTPSALQSADIPVITDAQHGTRAGGTLHPNATTSVSGFHSAADKVKEDAYPPITGLTPGTVLTAITAASIGFTALTAGQLPTHQHALADLLQGSATTGQYSRWSGTAWAPSAILAADIPNLDTSKLTTGQLALARGRHGVGARVYRTTNQSIANATNTVLLFDAERQDTDTLHSTVSNTGRLTAPYTGFYAISVTVAFDTFTTVGIRQLQLEVNSTTTIQVTTVVPNSYTFISVSALYHLTAGDYVQAIVYQTTGGSLNVLAAGNYSPEFAMQLIDID